MEHVRKMLEQNTASSNTGFERNGWYSMRDGIQIVRFLPPWSASGIPSKEVHKHYAVPPDNKTLMCIGPANFQGAPPCPVCEGEHAAYKAGLKLKCRAQPRFFLNGIVRRCPPVPNKPDPSPEEPVIIEIPATLHRDLMSKCAVPEIGNFFDPYQGMDVMITRSTIPTKGSQSKTEYSVQILTHLKGMIFLPEQGGQVKTDFILTKLADLDKIFVYPNDEGKISQYRNAGMTLHGMAAQKNGVVPTVGAPATGAGGYPPIGPSGQPAYPPPAPYTPPPMPVQPPVWTPPAPVAAPAPAPVPTAPAPVWQPPVPVPPPTAPAPAPVATAPAPVWNPPPPSAQAPAPVTLAQHVAAVQPQKAPTAVPADPRVLALFPNGFPVIVPADEWVPGKNGCGAPECYGNISAVRPVATDVCNRCAKIYPCTMAEAKAKSTMGK